MRNNQPVTQREVVLGDDVTLMSTTDVHSHIAYANAAFVAVSGYSREELQGQPHNLVRHPDMPSEAFADMWSTLKGGEPWTALVKNRAKNGDHYWVRANATPVVRNGQHVGYMSVRTTPTRDEVAAAEALYKDLREGRAQGRRLHKGLVLKGAFAWTRTIGLRWRLRGLVATITPLVVAAAALAGSRGTALAAVAGATAVASLLVCLLLERQIARPVEALRDTALKVLTGQMRSAVHMDRVDEIGMTMRAVSQLGLMFRWIIDDVSDQVKSVQVATSEIAQGNQDLSSRTEQAAASVQETASAMQQMTVTVQNNAAISAQANDLSSTASSAAERGGQVVSEVVSTMQDITDASRRIADIIGVIDGIAFQTNILALNAAVEAARAGDQGRGFAVVAGEVRSLAQRSADAAKEIKSLIGASVDKVESGARRVDEAGRSMDDIVGQVRRVSGLIAEISAATAEQSGGIGQIGQAVGHLDTITQQNAALVEQSAAASASLRQQADRLVEAVNVFR